MLRMRIGDLIKTYRWKYDIGLREMSKQIGISHGTLSRIERGENMDGEVLAKIICWLLGQEEKGQRK